MHDNVDPAELDKFSRMADRWWDPEGECKPLHRINPLRLDWITRQADGLASRRVLDLGCGGGILSESMAAAGATVTGIDLAEDAITVARRHAADADLDIDYRILSAEALAEAEPATFDVVACMEMLEHVPDPTAIVQATARLLRPGGVAVFSTINRNAKAWLFAIIGAEYVLRLLPRGTHQYDRLIRPAELARRIRAADLEVTAEVGLTYNPLMDHYRLTADTDVNYLMACSRPDDDNT